MMKRFLSAAAAATLILTACSHTPTEGPLAGWDYVPSAPAPQMTWVPAGAFRTGERTPETVTAIVIHTTEGRWSDELTHEENQERNFRNVINYFKDNDRNVSSHYVIGRNGEICQMVDESNVAHTQTYYNGRAFGIECAGWSSRPETWSPEMMDALVDLCAYLCVKWEIPAYQPEGTAYEGPWAIVIDEDTQRFTGPGLVGHYQVQPWNKSDPGEHFPWDEFSQRVRDRIVKFGGEPIALPDPQEAADAEVVTSASVKEETVRPGEPFTYRLVVRGPGAEETELDAVVFPDFTVHENLTVLGDPARVETEPGRAVFEVPLQLSEAGRLRLGASRVRLSSGWSDSGTLGVRAE